MDGERDVEMVESAGGTDETTSATNVGVRNEAAMAEPSPFRLFAQLPPHRLVIGFSNGMESPSFYGIGSARLEVPATNHEARGSPP